jgi:hypothetical protein
MAGLINFAARRSTLVFGALAGASSIVVLWLGLGLTFFSDEWAFIEKRSVLDPSTWWAPHNEHWSTLPILVYGALLQIVGLRTYVPYLAVVYALHVVACAGVFVLVRRRSGPLAGLAAAAIALLLGSGFENLFWGMQLGFVGSTAAGIWALAILDLAPTGRRRVGVAALLTASLASSGIGLAFLVAVGTALSLSPAWKSSWRWMVIPAAAYATWFVVIGHTGLAIDRQMMTVDTLAAIPRFVAGGFANAAGAVLGIGPDLSLAAAGIALAAAVGLVIRRRSHRPVLAAACATGLVCQYTLIAATRASVTEHQVDYSRYTYVGALLALIALADMAGSVRMLSSPLRRRVLIGTLAAILEFGLIWNVRLLFAGRDLFADRAMATRALVSVALDPAYSDRVARDRNLVLVPAPASLEAIVARYGSPLTDVLVPGAVPPITPAAIQGALSRAAAVR